MNLPSSRTVLRLSQSRLAKLAGVSRFKICLFEIGDGGLTPEEQNRIRAALEADAERFRNISVQVDLGQSEARYEGTTGD